MKMWRSAWARVLAVFMIGIIIPTGGLIYLGVRSIQAETLLLTKQSQERVGDTLRAMQDQAGAIIDGSRKFAEGLTPETIPAKPAGVSFLLALNASHYLVYPVREGPEQAEHKRPFLQVSFQQGLQAAERAETAEPHDYSRALEAYRDLARRVSSPYWKVKFLAAAANCLVKLGREDAAEAQYQDIISRHSAEPDETGRPFGLVMAIQLADLQMQQDRRSIALATELNAYQDLLNGQWKLSWDDEQAQARALQEKLAESGALMSPADHRQFARLNSAWRLKENAAMRARTFVARQWGPIQSRLSRQGSSDRPILLFEGGDTNRGLWVIPSVDPATRQRRGWLIAEIPCRELWAQIGGTLDEMSGAARAAYRLVLGEVPLLSSRQGPEHNRYPLQTHISRTLPALTLDVGQLNDMPVQRLGEHRRQIYLAVVVLASMVILVALYATWHAVSREVELAKLKAQFVASISHELKTPLSIIGLIGQRLKVDRNQTKEQAREYYGILAEETDRLKSLIDDVLDFSRLHESGEPYRKESADLATLVRESMDRCRQIHPKKDLEMTFQPSAEPCMAMIDREAMGRVVVNLLDNAVKYSPPDRIRITVSLRRDGRQALLEVADKGFGIPPEELQLVFERFFRGKSSMAHQKTNGVGLGLSIVQQIVKAHEGTVEVRSTEGVGSTFTIRLPADGKA